MKALFLMMLATALTFGAFATGTFQNENPVITEQNVQQKDVYLFKGAKLWLIKDGQQTEVTEDVTLANGTVIKSDGTVQPKEGDQFKLKENQYIDTDGNVGDWKDDNAPQQ